MRPLNQSITDCLHAAYGIQASSLTFLPGVDQDTAVYKAVAGDNSFYFVKLKRGRQLDFGIAIVELLHDRGVQQIIPPIKTKEGRLTTPLEDYTLVVYPFIEATDGFSRSLTDDQWITLGKALRQVHAIDLPAPFKNQIRKETFSPKWRNIVRALYPLTAHYPDTIITLLKEQESTLKRLVERAEQLAQKLQGQSHHFVLCHSDIHGGNVLLKGNNVLYIVDWDEPILAPKERDLMFIGGGINNVWNEEREEILFYKGYGKTDINREILAYYRQERIIEDTAIYAQQLQTTTELETSEICRHFQAQFDPNGVVDIALQTDISA